MADIELQRRSVTEQPFPLDEDTADTCLTTHPHSQGSYAIRTGNILKTLTGNMHK